MSFRLTLIKIKIVISRMVQGNSVRQNLSRYTLYTKFLPDGMGQSEARFNRSAFQNFMRISSNFSNVIQGLESFFNHPLRHHRNRELLRLLLAALQSCNYGAKCQKCLRVLSYKKHLQYLLFQIMTIGIFEIYIRIKRSYDIHNTYQEANQTNRYLGNTLGELGRAESVI